MNIRKIKENINVFIVKQPAGAILIGILLLNIALFMVAAFTISQILSHSIGSPGFWTAMFFTISMILDAGCIQFVVSEVNSANALLIVVCLLTVLIGMITFTGAVIGYVTNYISNFIDSSHSGVRSLKISEHTVILNWNTRASEIINDLLYSEKKETVVILVAEGSDNVKKEILDRVSVTLRAEQHALEKEVSTLPLVQQLVEIHRRKLRNKLSIIVREGDTYSTKQLNDISLSSAKTVIILSKDVQNTACRIDFKERVERAEHGNSNTIKALVQVAEMTSGEESADDQVIIVEVEDDWTLKLVNKIIEHKERLGKCNIIALPVNQILGQILSQFSIMPELNTVYSELFSNSGVEFFCIENNDKKDENEIIHHYLSRHKHAIPVSLMDTKLGRNLFAVAECEKDLYKKSEIADDEYSVSVNKSYWLETKNVAILGHNSKTGDIMNGFNAFRAEWNQADGSEILNIIVIDDKQNLEKQNYYKDYPYIKHVIEADAFDGEIICEALNGFIDNNIGDTSILILSDDAVPEEDIDASTLTYLIYVQDIISEHLVQNNEFDRSSIDVVVEILNPKNYDVVHHYSVNNVVISNRYISKMVTQMSCKDALFEFYRDILTYDDGSSNSYDSKEMYIKKVSRFFAEPPARCTAGSLIRAVFDATPEDNKAIVIGYVQEKTGKTILFSGDQYEKYITLSEKDKLVLYSNH